MSSGKSDEQLDNFWAWVRSRMVDEVGKSGSQLSLADRLAISRRMTAEVGRTIRNIVQLAALTRDLHKLVVKANEVAVQIVAIDEQNKLAPLSAPPLETDAREWQRALERIVHLSDRASTHLTEISPDIIEQLGSLAASDEPKSKPKKKG